MAREPDWEALSELQFLLYNRIADSLNAALTSIALSDMPEAQDKPPGFWKNRATAKIANVLNLFTAWSYLIRFKMGESIPERAIRPFPVNDLLAWLGSQLQLTPTPSVPSNPQLHANRETLQEALLLLHSAAYTQGTNVRLGLEASDQGVWFRIQFARLRPLPASYDDLLASFGSHWRAKDTVFELTHARDFVRLNGCEVTLNTHEQIGEFAFFVYSVKAFKARAMAAAAVAATTPTPVPTAPQAAAPSPAPAPTPAPAATRSLDEITPPSLAMLRPPRAMSAEGQVSPVEPDETAPKPGHSAETKLSRPTTTEPETLIVTVKIPGPKPPDILRTPPASTSNVALTRETQHTPPVSSAPAPAENTDAAARESESSPHEEKP